MPQRGDSLLQGRQEKLDRLLGHGIDPFPADFHRTHTTSEAKSEFQANEDKPQESREITVAGRVMRVRRMGKVAFVDIKDGEGLLQVYLKRDSLGDAYTILDAVDLGDFVGVTGILIRTKTGEISIAAQGFVFLSKSMRPLPEKWHGLRDQEKRYRQRYLDLVVNEEVHVIARKRARIITSIRTFLDERGFLEVETPILVPVPAGAMAEPFATHHNALDLPLYLRIATELYLKRLIVGGMDKVYEIGRVFRNEGMDADHNPEFTMLESYESYTNYLDVMDMVEQLVFWAATEGVGKTKVEFNGSQIELTPPWNRMPLKQAIKEFAGLDLDEFPDAQSLAERMRDTGLTVTYAESRGRLIDKLVSSYVEPQLIQPVFLIDYPIEMSPLAKARKDDPRYVERFEAFVGGMEIANAFTELNDPVAQRGRLEEQENLRKLYKTEDLERIDEDFLLALEHGMPPTGGLGMGIDRLVMLLTSQRSIRDVVLFPQIRPFG